MKIDNITSSSTKEVELLRKQVNRLDAAVYASIGQSAKWTRQMLWRFKTGRTIDVGSVKFQALQKAYERHLLALRKVAGHE